MVSQLSALEVVLFAIRRPQTIMISPGIPAPLTGKKPIDLAFAEDSMPSGIDSAETRGVQ